MPKLTAKILTTTLLAAGLCSAATLALADGKLTTVKACIFDPLGSQGPAFSMAKDQSLEARRWGIDLVLEAYTDERIAAETFKAGQCDMVDVPTLRARQFVKFAGSADSIGGLQSYQEMNDLVQLMANPKMGKMLIDGDYEVAGLVPLGAAYVMVRDRAINSVETAAGRKVAVLDWDKSQSELVQRMGAQPVASDVTNFFGKFNNGQVDIIASPAIAYKPFELYKGLGNKGAVYRFPLAQVTGSLIIRRSKMPPNVDIGQKAREYIAAQVKKSFDAIAIAEKDIPERYWMDLKPSDKEKYIKMMREARILLTKEGVYDPRMMSVLKRIRCKHNPTDAECTMSDE